MTPCIILIHSYRKSQALERVDICHRNVRLPWRCWLDRISAITLLHSFSGTAEICVQMYRYAYFVLFSLTSLLVQTGFLTLLCASSLLHYPTRYRYYSTGHLKAENSHPPGSLRLYLQSTRATSGDSHSDPINYRPIFLLSTLSKV